jgi:hypothetical protein
MPCGDSRVDDDKRVAERLACLFCRTLIDSGQPLPSWAAQWWKDHAWYDEFQRPAGTDKQDPVELFVRRKV